METGKKINPKDRAASLAGHGLQIFGDVRLEQDGVIRAKVKGNVQASGKLVVAKEAEISGAVSGVDIRLEGKVDAGLQGRGRVWLVAQSVLRTQCAAKALRIEPGADFRGELRIGESLDG